MSSPELWLGLGLGLGVGREEDMGRQDLKKAENLLEEGGNLKDVCSG